MSFKELEGKTVSVLTENYVGKLIYRPMAVFKTGSDQELLRVTLDDGTTIDCTPNHEFFDIDRSRVEAHDLVPGQRACFCLPSCQLERIIPEYFEVQP